MREKSNEEIKTREKQGGELGGKGKDPTTVDLPSVIPIEIIRPFFNFYGLPKLPMMKMSNFGNYPGLLKTHMLLRLLRVFSQG